MNNEVITVNIVDGLWGLGKTHYIKNSGGYDFSSEMGQFRYAKPFVFCEYIFHEIKRGKSMNLSGDFYCDRSPYSYKNLIFKKLIMEDKPFMGINNAYSDKNITQTMDQILILEKEFEISLLKLADILNVEINLIMIIPSDTENYYKGFIEGKKEDLTWLNSKWLKKENLTLENIINFSISIMNDYLRVAKLGSKDHLLSAKNINVMSLFSKVW